MKSLSHQRHGLIAHLVALAGRSQIGQAQAVTRQLLFFYTRRFSALQSPTQGQIVYHIV
jgi:hypothetical protein